MVSWYDTKHQAQKRYREKRNRQVLKLMASKKLTPEQKLLRRIFGKYDDLFK